MKFWRNLGSSLISFFFRVITITFKLSSLIIIGRWKFYPAIAAFHCSIWQFFERLPAEVHRSFISFHHQDMFCTKTISWLLFVAACYYLIPTGRSSTEVWRSGSMARSACEQWEEFNKTGVIPQPIKDVGTTELCGWFSRGMKGDACADIRHYWLGCKIPSKSNSLSPS